MTIKQHTWGNYYRKKTLYNHRIRWQKKQSRRGSWRIRELSLRGLTKAWQGGSQRRRGPGKPHTPHHGVGLWRGWWESWEKITTLLSYHSCRSSAKYVVAVLGLLSGAGLAGWKVSCAPLGRHFPLPFGVYVVFWSWQGERWQQAGSRWSSPGKEERRGWSSS